MRSALRDTVEVEFALTRPGGGRVTCTTAADSDVIYVDRSQAQPVPDGARLLADFLDDFEASPDIAEVLPDVRREIARDQRADGNAPTLKQLRMAAGLSQIELANAIRGSQSMVSLLEARKQEPTERTLRRLAEALRVDFNTLMEALANG